MTIARLGYMAVLGLALAASALADSIDTTPHNLSATGPGTIRTQQVEEICVFCHTPHDSLPDTPLWNRELSDALYTVYTSSTLDANPGQPTGASKLCLSCHDGTVALGSMRSRTTPVDMLGTSGTLPSGRTNVTTDLSDDHPVSFVYDSRITVRDPQIVDPLQLPPQVKLDENLELQCVTCHDPHTDRYGHFLVMDNSRSALCVVCHRMQGWTQSDHRNSTAAWTGAGLDPWPDSPLLTVADNACGNCHKNHQAGHPVRLLGREKEEDNCLNCHDGSVARGNIAALISDFSGHDVRRYVNVHDPREVPTSAPPHVACGDCHNPHAVNGAGAQVPFASGALSGVSGVASTGIPVSQAQYEYAVCYKCHGDNPGRAQSRITRQITQSNVRLEFDPGSVSFHPVEMQGKNTDVPSLIPPRTVSDTIYCSDCHGSPSSKKAGGVGPDGPHGSTFAPILIARYETSDGTSESPQSYALCYRCHDRSSILGDESFSKHKKHVQEKNTPCSVCHDAHGISSSQGTAAANSHLINFDTSIVRPDPETGRLEFRDLGSGRGECYLLCHGERHSPEGYD